MSEQRLIVVSNRLPLTLRGSPEGWVGEPSAGGLVTALGPVLERTGGLWFGWPGEGPQESDPGRQAALERWERERGYVAVDLPRGLATRFYQGYPNQALWPLFHQFPSLLEFSPKSWQAYVEANERFRDAVLERLQPGDLVWVHDYHLMLLPRLLREAAPDVAIGFFLHIPFPSSEVFRILPRREEILLGILGADYAAFQTHRHVSHFRSSVLRILGLSSSMDRLFPEGRAVQLEALPIGIAPESFVGLLERDGAVHAALGKRSFATDDLLENLEAFMDHLVSAGFDPVYGARPLKRAIQQELENPLAQRILAGEFEPGQTIVVDLEGDSPVFNKR